MGRSGWNDEHVVTFGSAVADEVGFDGLTLARLAERLGIRTPTLYSHVDGLDDLRRRIAEFGARALGQRLGLAVAGLSGQDALTAVATAYRAYANEHPGTYTAVERGPALGADPGEMQAPVNAVIAALRGYGLTGDDEIHAVRVIRAALHGFLSLELNGGFALELDLDASFGRLVATLHRGLAP
jgi:AcrR family transcriptional regulator